VSPGVIPSCNSDPGELLQHAANADPYMLGGALGYLGSATAPASLGGQIPDHDRPGDTRCASRTAPSTSPVRYKYGHNERGAILSASTFPTNAGIQVTFKTVTYHGDSAAARARRRGRHQLLPAGRQPDARARRLRRQPRVLVFECNNTPHDGLTGGYIGLGIDEYGNFLNGTYLNPGYTGTNVRPATTRPTATATSRIASDCAAPAASPGRRSRRVRNRPGQCGTALLSGLARDLLQQCGRRL
jgi:hypothetical protein